MGFTEKTDRLNEVYEEKFLKEGMIQKIKKNIGTWIEDAVVNALSTGSVGTMNFIDKKWTKLFTKDEIMKMLEDQLDSSDALKTQDGSRLKKKFINRMKKKMNTLEFREE